MNILPDIDYFDSPIGKIKIKAANEKIYFLKFIDCEDEEIKKSEVTENCKLQLDQYFQGKRKTFEIDFHLDGTQFQRNVLNEVYKIPFGKTASYMDIASSIGNLKSIRAVGSANGKNQIPIIIPCHRIVGANGKLVGYNGGMWRKEWLLKHEQSYLTLF